MILTWDCHFKQIPLIGLFWTPWIIGVFKQQNFKMLGINFEISEYLFSKSLHYNYYWIILNIYVIIATLHHIIMITQCRQQRNIYPLYATWLSPIHFMGIAIKESLVWTNHHCLHHLLLVSKLQSVPYFWFVDFLLIYIHKCVDICIARVGIYILSQYRREG